MGSKSPAEGHFRVDVRLLQMYPIHPDSRAADRTRHFVLDDARQNVLLGRASANRQLTPAPSNLWLESPIITKEHARFMRGPSIYQVSSRAPLQLLEFLAFVVANPSKPLLLRDLNSTHGTEVAGQKIFSDTPVADGDVVRFGEHITNGPLNFEPPTFLVQYETCRINMPPSPRTSSPNPLMTTTSYNHFVAPVEDSSDSESLLDEESVSGGAVDLEIMHDSVAVNEVVPADELTDDDRLLVEQEQPDIQASPETSFSDTSSSAESDAESPVNDYADLDLESSPAPSLPTTQIARRLYQSRPLRTIATGLPRDRHAPTSKSPLMEISNVITIPDSIRNSPEYGSGEAGSSSQESAFAVRGSSPHNPIVVDSSTSTLPDMTSADRSSPYRPRSPNLTSLLTRETEASVQADSGVSQGLRSPPNIAPAHRQPSPSDAALVRPPTPRYRINEGTLASSDDQQYSQQQMPGPNVGDAPGYTSFSTMHEGHYRPSVFPANSRPPLSNYNDDPFKATEQSEGVSAVSSERNRASMLAIEELIHPPKPSSPSPLKRTRGQSNIDGDMDNSDNDLIESDFYTLPTSTVSAPRWKSMGGLGHAVIDQAFIDFRAKSTDDFMSTQCLNCGTVRVKNVSRQRQHLLQCQIYLQAMRESNPSHPILQMAAWHQAATPLDVAKPGALVDGGKSDLNLLGPPLSQIIQKITSKQSRGIGSWLESEGNIDEAGNMADDDLDQDGLGIDDDDLGFEVPIVVNPSVGQRDQSDVIRMETYLEQIRALERRNRERIQEQQPASDFRRPQALGEHVSGEELTTFFEDDGLQLPEMAQKIAEEQAEQFEASVATVATVFSPKASSEFSGPAVSEEAATLSSEITRGPGGHDVGLQPPAKKIKTSHSTRRQSQPRLRSIINKAVPFMAGAIATAATIFAGAGVIISTIHEELRQEALLDMGFG